MSVTTTRKTTTGTSAGPCCGLHERNGTCCGLHDCAPCCPQCPTCPTLARRRGEPVRRYRQIRQAGHPLAEADGKVYVHRLVLFEKIGPNDHPCTWCERPLSWTGVGVSKLLVDHVDADTLNNRPGNLVPACRPCNRHRAVNPRFLTHCSFGHEKNETNTYVDPNGYGRCRRCKAERDRVRFFLMRGIVLPTAHVVTTSKVVATPSE